MALGKLPVGRPTDMNYSRARANCACSRCVWGGGLYIFLSSVISHLSLFEKAGWLVVLGLMAL